MSLENVFLYILSLHCSRGSFRPLSGYDVKSQSRSRRQLQEAGATSMDLKRASSRRSFEQGLLINSMYNDYGFQGVNAETLCRGGLTFIKKRGHQKAQLHRSRATHTKTNTVLIKLKHVW